MIRCFDFRGAESVESESGALVSGQISQKWVSHFHVHPKGLISSCGKYLNALFATSKCNAHKHSGACHAWDAAQRQHAESSLDLLYQASSGR